MKSSCRGQKITQSFYQTRRLQFHVSFSFKFDSTYRLRMLKNFGCAAPFFVSLLVVDVAVITWVYLQDGGGMKT